MTNMLKGGLTLRNFFRVINGILMIAALLAVGFCFYFAYSYFSFPVEKYNAQITDIYAQTEQLRAKAVEVSKEAEQRVAFLREDIRNNGKEAVAIADSLDEIKIVQTEKNEKLESLRSEAALLEDLPAAVLSARKEYALKIRDLEEKILNGETKMRICYWTLDGGPTDVTQDFLDALDELGDHVHVTFFTSKEAYESSMKEEMLRREMASGHSIQNGGFSGSVDFDAKVYRSLESLKEQIKLQDDWLFEVTGFHPSVFRFPGGSTVAFEFLPEATEVIDELVYEWVDWNCDLNDAGAPNTLPSSSLETTRVLTQVPEEPIAIILSHDTNLNTQTAMKTAIPMLQEQGYVFLPLFPESVMMRLAATD